MKLVIDWPSGWTIQTHVNFTEIAVAPSLAIRMRSIALPVDITTWMHNRMIEDLPANTETRVVRSAKQQSLHGWPVNILHYTVEDEAGTIVEERVGTFYRLLYMLGEVVVRAQDSAVLARELPRIQELVLGAKIEWPRHAASTLHGLLAL